MSLDRKFLEAQMIYEKKISDLEAKLAESELKVCELQFKALKRDVKKYKNADKELLNENINLEDEVRELKQQLAEKDKAIENWQTMYESVVQTCHNDKEEIERLNKQLATQENTITNLIEDNRASQEWYKKQLEESEEDANKWKSISERLASVLDRFHYLGETPLYNTTREQDKISFAVKKIQDLKKSLRNKVCLMENDEHCYPQNAIHWQDVVALIDNQIKQLKEMK